MRPAWLLYQSLELLLWLTQLCLTLDSKVFRLFTCPCSVVCTVLAVWHTYPKGQPLSLFSCVWSLGSLAHIPQRKTLVLVQLCAQFGQFGTPLQRKLLVLVQLCAQFGQFGTHTPKDNPCPCSVVCTVWAVWHTYPKGQPLPLFSCVWS